MQRVWADMQQRELFYVWTTASELHVLNPTVACLKFYAGIVWYGEVGRYDIWKGLPRQVATVIFHVSGGAPSCLEGV
eukprot:COSAG02_NODE_42053_length_388_cov_0.896194_1_plen_76_part_10